MVDSLNEGCPLMLDCLDVGLSVVVVAMMFAGHVAAYALVPLESCPVVAEAYS